MAENNTKCRQKCWVGGAVAGLVVTVFLLMVSHFGFGAALFLGLITFGLFGSFLVWAFCSDHTAAAPMQASMSPSAPVAARLPQAAAPTPAAPTPAAPTPAPVAVAPTPVATPAPAAPAAAAAPAAFASAPVAASAPAKPAAPAAKPVKASAPTAKATKSAAKPAATKSSATKTAATKTAKPTATKSAVAASTPVSGGKKPAALKAPRRGKADDLKTIEGIGPVLERLCNELGIYHFDQIAKWGANEIDWMDSNLKGFRGRVTRDKWVAQARLIGEEGIEAFLIRAKTNDY